MRLIAAVNLADKPLVNHIALPLWHMSYDARAAGNRTPDRRSFEIGQYMWALGIYAEGKNIRELLPL